MSLDKATPPTTYDQIDFDSYDDKELYSLSQELYKKIQNLVSENQMFESYYKRVMPNHPDEQDKQQIEDQNDRNKEIRREKKKKGEKQKEQDKPNLLTTEQKVEISTREVEELKEEIEKSKDEWSKQADNYKVNND
jgi:type IV secretory pathway VirB4 component